MLTGDEMSQHTVKEITHNELPKLITDSVAHLRSTEILTSYNSEQPTHLHLLFCFRLTVFIDIVSSWRKNQDAVVMVRYLFCREFTKKREVYKL